ncbi:MAG: hypothetical protein QM522_01040 [Chitinophagaceae bacterium]|nr:hypothetical protein [Chitinophagaceae bacterium]
MLGFVLAASRHQITADRLRSQPGLHRRKARPQRIGPAGIPLLFGQWR